MKIQIYPSSELANALICAAQSKDLSLNALILEVLENKFLEKENMPVSELTNIVFKEVTSYVEQNTDKEFDLFVASETFRNIPMTADGKPSPPGRVHFALDRADRRKARRAQQVEHHE